MALRSFLERDAARQASDVGTLPKLRGGGSRGVPDYCGYRLGQPRRTGISPAARDDFPCLSVCEARCAHGAIASVSTLRRIRPQQLRPAALRAFHGLQLLGEPDEQSFGAANVAEAIDVLVLHDFADELRAVLSEPEERVVEVLHREHDA